MLLSDCAPPPFPVMSAGGLARDVLECFTGPEQGHTPACACTTPQVQPTGMFLRTQKPYVAFPAVAQMETASLHFSRYTVPLLMPAGFEGLSSWWQQGIGLGHSTWAFTVHVRHPMCVRCKK
jgi:hypothetical protein